ncbi:MAG: amidohydrolase family protein [candidate division WS1 bacterium]|jgi:predicted TIM-barrel fold metal-dependent hydrolase|nr:amidohydrolase family protein [candidate division WS1 bacterium]
MHFDADQKQALFDSMCEMPTVDAHEHLHSEEMRTGRDVDIFLLFHQYLRVDLILAGMAPADADALAEPDVPLERKWETFAPHWDLVRTGAVAGPPLMALQRFFDEDDITAANYEALTERMRANNVGGCYERYLREACNIVLVLNQNRTMWQTDLFRPIMHGPSFIGQSTRQSITEACAEGGYQPPNSLPALLEIIEERLRAHKLDGMLGVKGHAHDYVPGDREAAEWAYPRIMAGDPKPDDGNAVNRYLLDFMYELCGELDLVVVQHTGVWAGMGADITTIRPTKVFDLAKAHPGTRFDVFHAGTPWPVDAGFLCRSLPNIYLNACWSHLLAPQLTKQAYDWWLDMLPINRVSAWGGDYWWAVENVYGVVMKTRDILAEVLAARIKAGNFDEARALQIARRWMHDNPREVYFID